MKDFKNYLFDFDGTLADTTDLIVHCFHEMLKRYGLHQLTDQEILKNIGMPLVPQLELFLGKMDRSEQIGKVKEYQEIQFKIFRDSLVLFPDVEETLNQLRLNGKKIAIVTSRSRKGLDLFIDHLGIRDLFDVMITPEVTGRHKPDPEPAFEALKQLGGKREESLFIGDASFDISCGYQAGMETAFVKWSHNPPEKLPDAPTYYLEKISDLLPQG